ncbi:MAG TPA: hypothetical protein VHM90_09245 [Phycisphaerae bacterium]|nr:hypothetical protein [Phycisphaerae bacterium]
MKKTILTGVVALLAIGFALYQRDQSHRLENSLQQGERDRAALQAKLDAGEKRTLAVERQLVAVQRARPVEAADRKSGGDAAPSAPLSPSSLRPPAANVTPAERAQLHERYDPFLARFGLTAEQRDRFVELKLEIAEAQHDLQVAVEENGASGQTSDVEALRVQATKPMWNEINQLLGPEGRAAYLEYEMTSAYRPAVTEIFREAGVPVSEQEKDQITRLVLQTLVTYHEKPTDISTHVRIDWSAVAHGAAGVLTPAQIAVLQARSQ